MPTENPQPYAEDELAKWKEIAAGARDHYDPPYTLGWVVVNRMLANIEELRERVSEAREQIEENIKTLENAKALIEGRGDSLTDKRLTEHAESIGELEAKMTVLWGSRTFKKPDGAYGNDIDPPPPPPNVDR